jgi:putative redox protein
MLKVTFEGGMRFVGQGPSGHPVMMDAAAAAGGADSAARPVEALLCALAGCTGMDVVATLRKMRCEPAALRIEVEHERAAEYPKEIKHIHLLYVVSGSVPEDKLRHAIDLSLSTYCSVANTLSGVAVIDWDCRITA